MLHILHIHPNLTVKTLAPVRLCRRLAIVHLAIRLTVFDRAF
jgi:hypothetical protein